MLPFNFEHSSILFHFLKFYHSNAKLGLIQGTYSPSHIQNFMMTLNVMPVWSVSWQIPAVYVFGYFLGQMIPKYGLSNPQFGLADPGSFHHIKKHTSHFNIVFLAAKKLNLNVYTL